MLQRIQTLYLLATAALMSSLLCLPLADVSAGRQFYTFETRGLRAMATDAPLEYPTWGLFVLTALIVLLTLVTIFLFKKRTLQIRLCIFNAILMLGFYGFALFFLFHVIKEQHPDVAMSVRLPMACPLISLVFNYLALRNIGADEMMVRSLERLR